MDPDSLNSLQDSLNLLQSEITDFTLKNEEIIKNSLDNYRLRLRLKPIAELISQYEIREKLNAFKIPQKSALQEEFIKLDAKFLNEAEHYLSIASFYNVLRLTVFKVFEFFREASIHRRISFNKYLEKATRKSVLELIKLGDKVMWDLNRREREIDATKASEFMFDTISREGSSEQEYLIWDEQQMTPPTKTYSEEEKEMVESRESFKRLTLYWPYSLESDVQVLDGNWDQERNFITLLTNEKYILGQPQKREMRSFGFMIQEWQEYYREKLIETKPPKKKTCWCC